MRTRPRLRWRGGLLLAVLVLAVAAFVLWRSPTNEYLFVPDRIRAVDPLVTVPGEHAPADAPTDGIYMVDILVRRANALERLLPFLNDDATVVPAKAFNPEGLDNAEKQKADALLMSRSQSAAEAVALRALGYDVRIERDGAEIGLVLPDSPADRAGLEVGDVIVAVQGQPVDGPEELRGALTGVEPGASIDVTVERKGARRSVRVGTRPAEDNPKRAVMGVEVSQAADVHVPLHVKIDAGDIGGPSAGLAFALDIVDELGPDLDRGRTIVATGELSLDGAVGAIGGIKQKTISARDAGADMFLVPVQNAQEAERYAGDLRIVPVATFSQALQALGAKLPAAA